jgi:hypothetical protein
MLVCIAVSAPSTPCALSLSLFLGHTYALFFNIGMVSRHSSSSIDEPAAPILPGGTRYLVNYPFGGRLLLGGNNLTPCKFAIYHGLGSRVFGMSVLV